MSKISIIVPIYNQIKYLERCLNCLAQQTIEDIQIILVDDGSTDGSDIICDKIAQKDLRFKVFHKKNGGVSSAWIAGLQFVDSEIIGFMDPDDYCDADYFEKLYNEMKKNDADMVACGYIQEKENGFVINKVFPSKYIGPGVYFGEELDRIKSEFYLHANTLLAAKWLKLIKKDIVRKNIVYFDEKIGFGDDIGITFTCFCDCDRVVLIDYYGYHYVMHGESITHKVSKKLIDDIVRVIENIETICTTKNYSTESMHQEQYRQLIAGLGLILTSCESPAAKRRLLSELRNNCSVKLLLRTKNISENETLRIRILIKLFFIKQYTAMITIIKLKSVLSNMKQSR